MLIEIEKSKMKGMQYNVRFNFMNGKKVPIVCKDFREVIESCAKILNEKWVECADCQKAVHRLFSILESAKSPKK